MARIKLFCNSAIYDVQAVLLALAEIDYALIPADIAPRLIIDDRLYEGTSAILQAIKRFKASQSTAGLVTEEDN
jgi:hypothetical protein